MLSFSERFDAPETVLLWGEWHGLEGRMLKDPTNFRSWERYGAARKDTLLVTRAEPVARLRDGWPDLTADILSTILRDFDAGASMSARKVRNSLNHLRRLGPLA